MLFLILQVVFLFLPVRISQSRETTFLQGHRVKDLGIPVCRASVWALDLSFGLFTTVAKCSYFCRQKKNLFFFFFCSTGDWTQCFIPVKQLSYIPSQKKIFSNKIKYEKILFWAERCWSWLWIPVFFREGGGDQMYVCQEKCFLELSDTFYGKYLCFHLSFKCVDGTLQLRTLDTLQREAVWRPQRQEQPHPLGGYVTLRDSPRLSELHLCAGLGHLDCRCVWEIWTSTIWG